MSGSQRYIQAAVERKVRERKMDGFEPFWRGELRRLPGGVAGGLPWELGSGRVSLATKCMTVILPGGNFRAVQQKEGTFLLVTTLG